MEAGLDISLCSYFDGKHYLVLIQASGLGVVAKIFLERGEISFTWINISPYKHAQEAGQVCMACEIYLSNV
jgi:hypothetical protein